ncbi:MAG: hypothetical protein ACPGR2_16145 [Psychrobium sp.]
MQSWKNLSMWQKGLISILVLCAVVLMPELMPLIDIGGIELIFGFIVLNYKNAVHWFNEKCNQLKALVDTVTGALLTSAICRPKNFIIHGAACSLALFVTGSLLFSTSLLLPIMMMNGSFV